MLLFEHKQYLQNYDAESSCLLKLWQFNAYKKACRDYELLPGFVTSETQINPASWIM